MPPASILRHVQHVNRSTASRVALRPRHLHTSSRMSSTSTSAALYAVVTSPNATSKTPEDAKELQHHAKGEKGFLNPWASYRDQSGPQIGRQLLW